MKFFWLFTLALIIVIGLWFWSTRSSENTLGEICLSLSSSIAQAPGSDIGQADYDAYSSLKTPVLRPEQALERFDLADGFRIEVVAHEPMVTDPVAMDIDSDGRLWVVDMPSYMPVHDEGEWETAELEQIPKGRVVVLEDTNGDGVMDKQIVFIDELILPRAIKVLADGILVGEPPNVWFISDTNGDGKGDNRELVYDSYGDPSTENVEHMANGLMWGMDNWLHNSHNDVQSLRKVDGQWKLRSFHRLGQWGMTQDDWGRLYSTNNVRPLLTHLLPYGYENRHPEFPISEGQSFSIAPGQPIWPAHATGVNRGYREGMLDEEGRLTRVTATNGPVIYRGGQFGEDFRGNAFVPEPAANMILRYIIDDGPSEIESSARFAYDNRNFLTSTDERFRPVNMYNAPDGSLYVVDMYRGLFQHARFLTEYLRDYTVENDLHRPTGQFGRIYRIVRDDRPINYNTPRFSELTAAEIVDQLRNENGQIRDQAQQVLVQCSPSGVIPSLESLIQDGSAKAWSRLQALWTLEGYDRSIYSQDQLTNRALQSVADSHPRIRAAAIRILDPAVSQGNNEVMNRIAELVEAESSPFVKIQLLATLGEARDEESIQLIAEILNEYSDNPFFREVALSGVYQREVKLAQILRNEYGWKEENSEVYENVLVSLEKFAIEDETEEANLSMLNEAQQQLFEKGRVNYRACSACHGQEGEGMNGVATPLAGSQWVQDDPEVPIRIILQGFEGGAAERDITVFDAMPAHSFMSDENIAAILTYIRNSWGNDASPVEPQHVENIREQTAGRSDSWTPDELRNLSN